MPAAAREVLAKEFDLTDQAIRNWVKQVDQDQGRCEDALTTEERAELLDRRRFTTMIKSVDRSWPPTILLR